MGKPSELRYPERHGGGDRILRGGHVTPIQRICVNQALTEFALAHYRHAHRGRQRHQRYSSAAAAPITSPDVRAAVASIGGSQTRITVTTPATPSSS
jgi:hypothetical protein